MKHISHKLITYIIVHMICVTIMGNFNPPVSRPLKVYIMVLLRTILTHYVFPRSYHH